MPEFERDDIRGSFEAPQNTKTNLLLGDQASLRSILGKS
jgi:hypothetical protein